MSSARVILLSLALVSGAVQQTLARSIPPGKYHEEGRVVLKANGELTIFSGEYASSFPKSWQDELRPYTGKFVEVEYLRVAEGEGRISRLGSVIGNITKITVEAEDPAHLPIVCRVTPTKAVYELAEPIVVHVSVTNRTDKPHELGLGNGETTLLCQDYERKFSLDWLEEYYSRTPAWGVSKEVRDQYVTLAAGQTVEFEVTGQFMVEPGTYQVVYNTNHGLVIDGGNQSEVVPVTVANAKDAEAEHQALRVWLPRAAYPQRVEIAKKLLRFHDDTGTQEILQTLGTGAYTHEHIPGASAFHYAWKYGGKEGEKVMLDLIGNQKRQRVTVYLIQEIGCSPDHLALLAKLLDCKNPIFRDEDSWTRTLRVCDLTAAFLRDANSGDVPMKFPRNGSEEERDKAVAEVKQTLLEKPSALHIPGAEESTAGTAGEASSKSN